MKKINCQQSSVYFFSTNFGEMAVIWSDLKKQPKVSLILIPKPKFSTRKILSHPHFRLNIMSVRSKGLNGSENKVALIPGLMLATIGNTINRRFLKLFFERALFHDTRDLSPFYNMNDFPIHRVENTWLRVKSLVLN